MVSTLRPLYPHEETGIHCPGGWVIIGASFDVTEILASKGIRPPDRPARCKSLYQLRYSGRHVRI
jgi:hypothetical protein